MTATNSQAALRELVSTWLHPISDDAPAGALAEQEPAYEVVQAEIAKLDSLTGGEVNWPLVVQSGSEVLQRFSKDLRIACRVAYGLSKTGLRECALGVALVAELTDEFWETMFPSARRIRGRAGTMNWLIERLESQLGDCVPSEEDRPAVNLLEQASSRLDAVIQERFTSQVPSTSPLRRAVERLQSSLPELMGAVEQTSPSAANIGLELPAEVSMVGSDAPAMPPQGHLDPVTELGSESDEPSARSRVAQWLKPISDAKPAGEEPKYEPAYEAVVAEVAKLDSVNGGELDWKLIAKQSERILTKFAKDLVMASYLAAAWQELEGLAGISRGLILIGEMSDIFWDEMFPAKRRLRARVGILDWLFGRLEVVLGDIVPTADEREEVEALQEAVKALDAVCREKFVEDAPSLSLLRRAVERIHLSLPELMPQVPAQEEEEASAAPMLDGSEPSQSSAVTASPVAAAPVPAAPVPAVPAAPVVVSGDAPPEFEGQDASDYFYKVGDSLIATANTLRAGNPQDPIAYRIIRTGVWFPISSSLSADNGVTGMQLQIGPTFKDHLERMIAGGSWLSLVNECEYALRLNRYWFDLNRHSATGLAALGPDYADARKALILELATFLQRVPGLLDLSFADGTAFADQTTRSWISDEVLVAEVGAQETVGSNTELLQTAKELVGAGKIAEAIELLQSGADNAESKRERFRLRMAIAKTSIGAGQLALGRAIYKDLHEEAEARQLAQWDPKLAIEVLEGYFRVVRTLGKSGQNVSNTTDRLFEQLCALSPVLAMALEKQ